MSNLYGHNSFDSGYVVTNYPWGFRLKTSRRYWIETTKHGDRFCYATLNPKTAKWCKPKKSTYDAVMVMTKETKIKYLNSMNFGNRDVQQYETVSYFSVSAGWSDFKDIKEFEQKADLQKLSKEQLRQICYCKSVKQVHSKLSYSFENTTQLSQEEREKRDDKEKEINKKINKYGNYVYSKCLVKNNLL